MVKPKIMKLAELVLDYDVYPRPSLDSTHVSAMLEALESDAEFPALIACEKTKRVVDGFHRIRAFERAGIDEHTVELRRYASDAELVADAIRLNVTHGRRLTPYDRARCLLLAEKFGIDDKTVANAMNMTLERLGEIRSTRFATTKDGPIALKRTIRHMAGRKLNKRQVEANRRLSGMNAVFYVNQIIELLEADLLNMDDERLAERLTKLHGLLDARVGVGA